MHKEISINILNLKEEEWIKYLKLFDDASIYQTNAFAKFSKGGKNIEHFILKIAGKVVAVSLVRIIKIPLINRGIAYIRWGPLWQRKNEVHNIEIFDLALKSLIAEYNTKRKLILRIVSNHYNEDEYDIISHFSKYNFKKFNANHMTVIIDLSLPLDEIRLNFRRQWRYRLKSTEKSGLTIIQSSDEKSFDLFISIYKEMHQRKQFKEFVNVESFKLMNNKLALEEKMQIFVCYNNNVPISAMVVSAIGNSGIYLLGGINDEGLKYSASYLLQWEVIKWLKSKDIKWYNLGGIDPINGPGVYTFKTGMGGKEVTYLGGFELSKDMISNIILRVLKLLKK